MATLSTNQLIGLVLHEVKSYKEGLQRLENAVIQIIGKLEPQTDKSPGAERDGVTVPKSNCEMILQNFQRLTPKAEFPVVLEDYRMLLRQCSGPQYAAAVEEINNILSGLEHNR